MFGANQTLVGRVLKPHRDKITLARKGGMAGVSFDDGVKRVIDAAWAAIRRNCEDSLKRLGTEVIDLYRWDKRVPIEDSVGAMWPSGRAKASGARLGLSEVSAATCGVPRHLIRVYLNTRGGANVEIGVLYLPATSARRW